MLSSSIWVTAIALSGSALGLLNQLLMAYRFGASRTVDSFLIATSVPTFVGGLVAALLSYAVVPRVVAVSADQARRAAYVRAMTYAMLALGGALAALGVVLAPLLVRIGGSAFVDSTTVTLARMTWMATALQIVVAYLIAVCNAGKWFVRSALAGLGPYLGMLGANWWFGARFGIVVLPLGLAAGTAVALGYLAYVLRSTLLARTGPLPWRDVKAFFVASPLSGLAMMAFTVYAVVDAHLAPQLGDANLSYLGYSQRIVIALGNLAVAGPSAVVVPHLARAVAEGRLADFRRDTFRAVAIIAGVASAVALVVQLRSVDLIAFVFQRGAFDAEAAHNVARVLGVMLFGMIPMLSVVMLFRAIFCLGSPRFPAAAALAWFVLYFALGSLLAPRFRAVGMAYAYVASWLLVLAVSLAFVWRATRVPHAEARCAGRPAAAEGEGT